jgi:hypothetical protein
MPNIYNESLTIIEEASVFAIAPLHHSREQFAVQQKTSSKGCGGPQTVQKKLHIPRLSNP